MKVKTLYNEVSDIAPDYFTFGLNLGLPYHKLKEIERNHSEVARKLQEVIAVWLESNAEPKWQTVVASLREMERDALAQKISNKYCRIKSKG